MSGLFKWNKGRQATGYDVFTLIQSEYLALDCHILKYPTDSCIKPHVDKSEGGKHYRLNVELWSAKQGGKFKGQTIFSIFDKVHFVRPDKCEHEVTKIEKGSRWVLSIGKVV